MKNRQYGGTWNDIVNWPSEFMKLTPSQRAWVISYIAGALAPDAMLKRGLSRFAPEDMLNGGEKLKNTGSSFVNLFSRRVVDPIIDIFKGKKG